MYVRIDKQLSKPKDREQHFKATLLDNNKKELGSFILDSLRPQETDEYFIKYKLYRIPPVLETYYLSLLQEPSGATNI